MMRQDRLRRVVSLANEKGEAVVERSPIIIPYNEDSEPAEYHETAVEDGCPT